MRIRSGLGPLRPLEGGDPDIVDEQGIKADKKRKKKPGKYSLIRAAWHYGVPFISDEAKGEYRNLAQRKGDDYTPEEQRPHRLLQRRRRRYHRSVPQRVARRRARQSTNAQSGAVPRLLYGGLGVGDARRNPINLPLYRRLSMNATAIRLTFIASRGERFDVHERGHFSFEKYAAFLAREGLLDGWPRTAKGRLAISGKHSRNSLRSIQSSANSPADLSTIDLLESIGTSFDADGAIEEDQDKSKGLRICPDGYNRAPLLPFTTKTSRNAPPGRAFLFTNSSWMRPPIYPREDRAVAYLDWKAQELRIAAARSGDPALLERRPIP